MSFLAPPPIPDGFAPHFRKSPVTDPWEPLYSRSRNGVIELGLRLEAAHCNSRGFAHGGVIAALADNAMGLSYAAALSAAAQNATAKGVGDVDEGAQAGAVTVSLGLDYVAVGRIGQWLQISPRVLRAGKSMGFVDAIVTADGEILARANATFKRV